VKPWLSDTDVTLYQGDCLNVLAAMDAGSVDAVVTSPPYADARADVEAVTPGRFAEWLEPRLAAMLRVTRGSLMLNLGRRFKAGQESGYVFDTLAAAKSVGWLHIDTLIWRKTNANGRGGSYLHDVHEYVWWLARSADTYRGLNARRASLTMRAHSRATDAAL
jgi:DNA modification methylase